MNNKGFTLIELISVIAILAIIVTLATFSLSGHLKSGREKAFDILVNSFEDGVLEAYTSCISNPTGSNFCKNHSIPVFGGKDKVYLNELETEEFVEKMKNPWNTSERCDSDSFIVVTRDSKDNISFSYDTCLRCGNHESSGCSVNNNIGDNAGNNPASSSVTTPQPVSFATDSWDTIVANVRANGGVAYAPTNQGVDNQVLREVDLGELGKHYLRVANTTPCTNGETSETACGFVIEFADIISKQKMNTTLTNVGGYPDTDVMFNYVTSTVYNALPAEIRNSIIPTTVVSSHGSTAGEENFTTPQQTVYLLSRQEVFGDNSTYDTAASATRQLDYYRLNNTNSNRIKKYQGSASYWWLRSASSNYTDAFYNVSSSGHYYYSNATSSYGVSPAFRIG